MVTLEELEAYTEKKHKEYLSLWREEEDEAKSEFWDGISTAYLDVHDILRYGRRGNQQPAPKKSEHPEVTKLVVADLEERHEKGLKDYGVPLQPFNGRSALQDLYEELLDSVLYLRQLIYEMENHET